VSKTIREDVSESEFNMWRAVFAFSLLDNILSPQDQRILQPYSNTILFSEAQNDILKHDFKEPQNVEALYHKITDSKDKERFCVLARALAWCEGDMSKQEEAILKHLSCLAKGADDDLLTRTRRHPHLAGYFLRYSQDGMVGLYKLPPLH